MEGASSAFRGYFGDRDILGTGFDDRSLFPEEYDRAGKEPTETHAQSLETFAAA